MYKTGEWRLYESYKKKKNKKEKSNLIKKKKCNLRIWKEKIKHTFVASKIEGMERNIINEFWTFSRCKKSPGNQTEEEIGLVITILDGTWLLLNARWILA